MRTVGRQTSCIAMLLLGAACAIASAEAPAQEPRAVDPDDPKLAARFSGRVISPDGRPIAGARVYVEPISDKLDGTRPERPETGPLPERAETGADGRFEFDAPDLTLIDLDGLATRRWCIVVATADGYGPGWSETRGRTRSGSILAPIPGTDLELQLAEDDVPIEGRLNDAAGKPLAAARVRAARLSIPRNRDLDAHLDRVKKIRSLGVFGVNDRTRSYNGDLQRIGDLTTETLTDADGRFVLSGFGRDRLVRIEVSAPQTLDTALTVMTRDAPDVALVYNGEKIYGARFTLQLAPGRTIEGQVIDAETRQPIAGMIVGTGRKGFPRDGALQAHTRSDAQGRFKVTGLDPAIEEWPIAAQSAPGMPYLSGAAVAKGDAPVLIECRRGIPFRLKLVDEQGHPVEADVTYVDVRPNPHAPKANGYPTRSPISEAARLPDGSYEGFAVPGPGVVLAKIAGRVDYRPPAVDPKAFFAPGRTDWTKNEETYAYGSPDTVATSMGNVQQNAYAAIVLVNPPPDSPLLELTATVVADTPRIVSLVDPDDKPLVGAETQGMTSNGYDTEPPLRAASFPLRRLHPQRVQRITFIEPDRKLVGSLVARGDGETPYTVRLQSWGTVTGRIVDENGKAITKSRPKLRMDWKFPQANADPQAGEYAQVTVDRGGNFRVDRMVPGQRYSARIYRGNQFAGTAFEKIVVRPGENRNLGDIRTKPPLQVAAARTRPRD